MSLAMVAGAVRRGGGGLEKNLVTHSRVITLDSDSSNNELVSRAFSRVFNALFPKLPSLPVPGSEKNLVPKEFLDSFSEKKQIFNP